MELEKCLCGSASPAASVPGIMCISETNVTTIVVVFDLCLWLSFVFLTSCARKRMKKQRGLRPRLNPIELEKLLNLKATIEHIDGSSARYAVNIFSPEPDFSQANRGHRSATTEKALVNLTARLITTRNTEESRENPLLALGILFATWIRFLHV